MSDAAAADELLSAASGICGQVAPLGQDAVPGPDIGQVRLKSRPCPLPLSLATPPYYSQHIKVSITYSVFTFARIFLYP